MTHLETPTVSVARPGSPRGDPRSTVVWVRGEHDIATRTALVVGIARAARRDDRPLLVDLSGVTFMDASTIGAIVGSLNRERQRGQTLELRTPSPRARRVLELCGLTHLVQGEDAAARGPAAALATWVDVPPTDPAGVTRSRSVHPATARPSPVLISFDGHAAGGAASGELVPVGA